MTEERKRGGEREGERESGEETYGQRKRGMVRRGEGVVSRENKEDEESERDRSF